MLKENQANIVLDSFSTLYITVSSASLIGVRVVRISLDVMKKTMDIMTTVFLFLAYSHYLLN
ncbi:hypothetical protein [Paenibacillus sp. GP183]|uniref:hypothetical protein n=1 Tax=Paenibacillus sp. GP183 TaxID=1882751 RepID=UPI0011150866|nr:hypothetical protein [Paenibacillus sp. GP183]